MPNEDQKQDEQKQDQKQEEWKNVAEVKKIIADRDAFKSKLKEMEGIMEEYKTTKQKLSEYEEQANKRKQEAEKKKLEEAGEYQKIIEQNKLEHKKELSNITSKMHQRILPSAIKDAALRAVPNLLPNALDDLVMVTSNTVGIDNEFNVYVKNQDGKVQLDSDGKPMSLEKHLKVFIEARPWYLADRQPTHKGLKPGETSNNQSKTLAEMNEQERDEYKKANPEEYQRAIDAMMSPENMKKLAQETIAKRQALMTGLGGR